MSHPEPGHVASAVSGAMPTPAWVGDITSLPTRDGGPYLEVVIRPVTGPSTTLQDDLPQRETRLNHAFPDLRYRRGNVNLTQHVISIARVTLKVMPKNPCPPASVTHLSLVARTPSGSDLAWLVRMLLVHVQHARQAEGSG